MYYDAYKDMPRISASDKILCNKPFTIASELQYDRHQWGSASVVYKLFDKECMNASEAAKIYV